MNVFISIFIVLSIYYLSHNFIYATLGCLFCETLFYLFGSQRTEFKNTFFFISWIFVGLSLILKNPIFLQLKLSLGLFCLSVFLFFDWFSMTHRYLKFLGVGCLDKISYDKVRQSLAYVCCTGALLNLCAIALLPVLYWFYFKCLLTFSLSLFAYQIVLLNAQDSRPHSDEVSF